MRNPSGYATVTDPDRPLLERDTITCGHCQTIVFVQPGTGATTYLLWNPQTRRWDAHAGAACRVCMRPVCLACDADGRCTPWEQRLEQAEARDRLLRAATGG